MVSANMADFLFKEMQQVFVKPIKNKMNRLHTAGLQCPLTPDWWRFNRRVSNSLYFTSAYFWVSLFWMCVHVPICNKCKPPVCLSKRVKSPEIIYHVQKSDCAGIFFGFVFFQSSFCTFRTNCSYCGELSHNLKSQLGLRASLHPSSWHV